ncbi:unnamed protein product [Schistosoma mattheei]|uniref:Uncharacterized protein n=1 Tax=Schistosoma mattheei TaxID=31246 RepID=A0A3P8G1R3_9TREM|nr:unnamed protein product [Schistosoma mattheei]
MIATRSGVRPERGRLLTRLKKPHAKTLLQLHEQLTSHIGFDSVQLFSPNMCDQWISSCSYRLNAEDPKLLCILKIQRRLLLVRLEL